MTNDVSVVVDAFLKECERLKAEQTQRIGFRDNLLYVTLIAFGGALSFALSNPAHICAVLVIPWVCIILGWTYVVNVEKISAIGKYMRINLTEKVCALTGSAKTDALFGWEVFHRDDDARIRRKWRSGSSTKSRSSYLAILRLLRSF